MGVVFSGAFIQVLALSRLMTLVTSLRRKETQRPRLTTRMESMR